MTNAAASGSEVIIPGRDFGVLRRSLTESMVGCDVRWKLRPLETSVTIYQKTRYQTTRRNIPEDLNHRSQATCANIKQQCSYLASCLFRQNISKVRM
jgi:hypothetical protein